MKKLKSSLEHLFYLFIFFLPIQTRWMWRMRALNGGFWEYGTLSIYAAEVLLWVIFFLYAIYIFRRGDFLGKKFAWNKKTLLVSLVFVFIFLNFLSFLFSSDRAAAFQGIFRLLEGVALMFFIINFPLNFKKIALGFSLAGFFQGLLALWQFSEQKVFASKWLGMAPQNASDMLGESVIENSFGRFLRAYGTLPHPNMLGGFLVLAALSSAYLFLRAKDNKESLALLMLLSANILGIFLTFSRSAYIAVSLSLVIFVAFDFLRERRFDRTIFLTFAYLAIVLAFSLIYMEFGKSRFHSIGRLEKKSVAERQALFQESFFLIQRHPWLGVGPGNFTPAVQREFSSHKKPWEYQPVHSLYLLIASETGIISLGAFLIFSFLALARTCMKKNYFGFAALWGILAAGFFDHYFGSLYFGIIFLWCVFGIALRSSAE